MAIITLAAQALRDLDRILDFLIEHYAADAGERVADIVAALDVLTRLRRGQWAIQAQIDLHGLRRDEAREQLGDFVRQALQRGQRCVRVVHGKGLGSPGREPVLKAKVQRWLAQRIEVIAFTQATAAEGGAGALIVLLERRSAAR